MSIWKKCALVMTVVMAVIAMPPAVYADPSDLFPSACSGSKVCSDASNQNVTNVFKTVIEVLIWASGIISVLVIIIGGFMYVLSAGDQAKVTKAKDTVLYAVIGLVVTLLAFSIVKFVLGYF